MTADSVNIRNADESAGNDGSAKNFMKIFAKKFGGVR